VGWGGLWWVYLLRPNKQIKNTTVISSMERASKPPPGF
jgi:hypothetical protein